MTPGVGFHVLGCGHMSYSEMHYLQLWMSDLALWCALLKCKWLGLFTQGEINRAMGNLHLSFWQIKESSYFNSTTLKFKFGLDLGLNKDIFLRQLLCSKFRNYEGKRHKP